MNIKNQIKQGADFLSHPMAWLALAALFLFADYFSGPSIQFPITYVFPVLLAAWHVRKKWAVMLAVGMPVIRLSMVLIWDHAAWVPISTTINLVIRIFVLLLLAILTWHFREVEKEAKILRGLLPICMHCRKIRDENDRWLMLEDYLPGHSQAQLTHGLCPDCAVKFFPGFVPGKKPG